MKFKSEHFLKWLPPNHSELQGIDDALINQGVLFLNDSNNNCLGFTMFQFEDINQLFISKIEKRFESLQNGSSIEIICTSTMKSKLNLYNSNILNKLKYTISPFIKINIDKNIITYRSKVRVINVDDSPVMLKFLNHCLSNLDFVSVVSQVSDPTQAMSEILKHNPDVVSLDIQMPVKNGVELTAEISSKHNCSIILVSSLNLNDGSHVINALNNGAFDYIKKPELQEKEQFTIDFSEKILIASKRKSKIVEPSFKSRQTTSVIKTVLRDIPPNMLWCIGSSTGGTQALTEIFSILEGPIPPTLIVQHIPPVFSKAFANSLNQICDYEVHEAKDGDLLKSNSVYIAPGGFQMGLAKTQSGYTIRIKDDDPVNRFKPSVDYLFDTVSKYSDLNIIAVVLTGMGKDGAQGLLKLKNIGAKTFVQDEASSAVFGMPRAALEIKATDKSVPLNNIAYELVKQSIKSKAA